MEIEFTTPQGNTETVHIDRQMFESFEDSEAFTAYMNMKANYGDVFVTDLDHEDYAVPNGVYHGLTPDEIHELLTLIETVGDEWGADTMDAVLDHCKSHTHSEIVDMLRHHDHIEEFENLEDFARDMLEHVGDAIPIHLEQFFDYEAYAQSWEDHGAVTIYHTFADWIVVIHGSN